MNPTQAGALMRQARRYLRLDLLTDQDLTIFDCLLWCCRQPGAAQCAASYSRIRSLTRKARATIAQALTRFESLCLLRRSKRRVLVRGVSRQATTVYTFLPIIERPPTEFTRRTADRVPRISKRSGCVEAALERLGTTVGRERRLL